MDFIRQLQIFVAVVETGNFTRAADTLRMARPAVTNAINGLEKDVGARLLHRTTRRSSLTGEGELLYAHATTILKDVADTRNLFGGSGESPKGRLRIDIPVALAKPLVIPALPAFREAYPDVDIMLGVSDQPVDLVADAVDCVLRIGILPVSSMIARKIALMTMVICASPTYLARHGEPTTIEELREHQPVNYFSGRSHRPIPWSLPDGLNGGLIELGSTIMVNDAQALVGCALAGMGLVQVPAMFIADHLARGELVAVLTELGEVEWPTWIMYPNRQYLAPQVRLFIEWMVALVSAQRSEWLRPL